MDKMMSLSFLDEEEGSFLNISSPLASSMTHEGPHVHMVSISPINVSGGSILISGAIDDGIDEKNGTMVSMDSQSETSSMDSSSNGEVDMSQSSKRSDPFEVSPSKMQSPAEREVGRDAEPMWCPSLMEQFFDHVPEKPFWEVEHEKLPEQSFWAAEEEQVSETSFWDTEYISDKFFWEYENISEIHFWDIEQVSILEPVNIEDSPSSHQIHTPVRPTNEQISPDEIELFASGNILLPTPDQSQGSPMELGSESMKEEESQKMEIDFSEIEESAKALYFETPFRYISRMELENSRKKIDFGLAFDISQVQGESETYLNLTYDDISDEEFEGDFESE